MRRLRFIPQQHLVEITARTLHGMLLLRPGASFNEIFLGILGRAQRRFGMTIHCGSVLSNHYHLLLSPTSHQQLAAFACYLNGNLAKEVGRIYGWRQKIWGRRYQHIVVSNEEGAQVGRLRYLLSHGVKEGLVERIADWPGPNFLDALLTGQPLSGTWFDRTAECMAQRRGIEFGARDFATQEAVVLTPLPCWAHLSRQAQIDVIQGIVASIEEEAAAERQQTERSVLGAQAVLRQNPQGEPVRSKKSPAPWFHAASKSARVVLREAYDQFLAAYRQAAERLRAGDLTVEFPPGCFPPALPTTA
jgi:hypothetical protein